MVLYLQVGLVFDLVEDVRTLFNFLAKSAILYEFKMCEKLGKYCMCVWEQIKHMGMAILKMNKPRVHQNGVPHLYIRQTDT